MNNETERAAFDHWYSNEGQFPKSVERSRDGTYMLIGAQSAWNAWQARASAATQAVSEHIPATLTHDEGAFAQCGDCGRYTTNVWALTDRPPTCECGSKTGWSGSFKRPGADARWSGAAPVVPPVALPALTDEQIDREWMRWNVPSDDSAFAFYRLSASEQVRAAFVDGLKRGVVLAASAAPAPEQMQPNVGAEQDHLAGNRNEAPCGDQAAAFTPFPPLPLPIVKHPQVGNLYDGFCMQQFALRYADLCGVTAAEESGELQLVLFDLLDQVKAFIDENGEADFWTGPASALRCKFTGREMPSHLRDAVAKLKDRAALSAVPPTVKE